jgi:hygromycin-B 7''-O-kinase
MIQQIYQTSQRLGPISHEQLSRALARFGFGDLLAVEPVPFGLFGQNLFVTSSTGEYVFRGAPHGPAQFPTERFFTRLLHERSTVPVPWPFQIDASCEFFPWNYAFMPRMPGLQVTDKAVRRQLTRSDLLAIARAMARNLVAMQQITMPDCARYDPDRDLLRPVPIDDHANWPFNNGYGEVREPPAHRELIVARVRRYLASARAANSQTTPGDVEWVEALIARAAPALAEPLTPCFTMEDYKEGNAVLRRDADDWEVSGLFDFMGCYIGDGETDLSRVTAEYFDEDPGLAREFLTSYMRLKRPRPGFEHRFPLYMLLDRLIIWDYFQRNQPQSVKQLGTLRDWSERYTNIQAALGVSA